MNQQQRVRLAIPSDSIRHALACEGREMEFVSVVAFIGDVPKGWDEIQLLRDPAFPDLPHEPKDTIQARTTGAYEVDE
jgi:hypothetical protein